MNLEDSGPTLRDIDSWECFYSLCYNLATHCFQFKSYDKLDFSTTFLGGSCSKKKYERTFKSVIPHRH